MPRPSPLDIATPNPLRSCLPLLKIHHDHIPVTFIRASTGKERAINSRKTIALRRHDRGINQVRQNPGGDRGYVHHFPPKGSPNPQAILSVCRTNPPKSRAWRELPPLPKRSGSFPRCHQSRKRSFFMSILQKNFHGSDPTQGKAKESHD